jgi:hypothetical protein
MNFRIKFFVSFYATRFFCLFKVMTPRIIKAQPMARIKKSAGIIMAHTEFTAPAYKKIIERKTKAIPAIVSPLTLSKSLFLRFQL